MAVLFDIHKPYVYKILELSDHHFFQNQKNKK